MNWLDDQGDDILESYTSMVLLVLPDRLHYYEQSETAKMRELIYNYMDSITETFGFYPIFGQNDLLTTMTVFNFSLVFLKLVFDVVIILFVIISVLLIYSLMMITTETKTFDIGIMRLVGLSSSGFVAMIFTQAVMFVIPSIIFGYICAYPVLYLIFSKLFDGSLHDAGVSIVPSAVATTEAMGVGLLIPTLSAIIPI